MIYISTVEEALIRTVKAGNEKAFNQLLATGKYDINLKDATGKTAIGYAERRRLNNPDVYERIITALKNYNVKPPKRLTIKNIFEFCVDKIIKAIGAIGAIGAIEAIKAIVEFFHQFFGCMLFIKDRKNSISDATLART